MDVDVETAPQLLGRLHNRHAGIPYLGTFGGTRAVADIALAHPRPTGQFRCIIVQRNFWMFQYQQQCVLFGKGLVTLDGLLYGPQAAQADFDRLLDVIALGGAA